MSVPDVSVKSSELHSLHLLHYGSTEHCINSTIDLQRTSLPPLTLSLPPTSPKKQPPPHVPRAPFPGSPTIPPSQCSSTQPAQVSYPCPARCRSHSLPSASWIWRQLNTVEQPTGRLNRSHLSTPAKICLNSVVTSRTRLHRYYSCLEATDLLEYFSTSAVSTPQLASSVPI